MSQITLRDIKRWCVYAVAGLAAAIALTWAGDWTIVHIRGASGIGRVHVSRFLVTPLKGGKAEYDYVDEEDVPCSKSLFPQAGDSPCWYLQKHKDIMQAN